MVDRRLKTCLSDDELTGYLREQIGEQQELEIQAHLDDCPSCQESLERLAAGRAMWDELKDLPVADTHPVSEQENLISDYLAPTEDPRFMGRLGIYEICGILGQGSTGIVLKALEPRLNRHVAIKVLSPTLANNGAARQRFEREGRAIAAVSHEHVVPIYAVDEHRGLPYIVMKYVPGVTLLQRIQKSGPMDTRAVVRIGLQVARGLAAAHNQGIVHRDVKPANVLLENSVERAMVTDFGLARVADDATMTRTGTISGTPQYMSPEQARGESIDSQSDLFSLGSLLYAACTARAPFRAETVFGIIHRVCETEPRPIREINPDIAPWLVAFIEKLMHKRPTDRFAGAHQVADLLENELAHLQNPTTSKQPPRNWLTHKPSVRQRRFNSIQLPQRKALAYWSAGAMVVAGLMWLLLSGDGFGLGGFNPAKSPATGQGQNLPQPNGSAVAAQLFGPAFGTITPEDEPVITWTSEPTDSDSTALRFRQRIEQSFVVPAGGKMILNAGLGDIEVRQTELDQLSFVVLKRIDAANQAEAEKIASFHKVNVNNDDTIELTGALDPEFESRNDGQLVGVTYGLGVPAGMSIELSTSEGDITIGRLNANVRARVKNGDLNCGSLQGDLWARVVGGEAVLTEQCTGKANVMATHGNVCAANVSGESTLRASDGNIYLGPSQGNVSAHVTGGDLRIAGITSSVGGHVESGTVFVRLTASPTGGASLSVTDGDIVADFNRDVALLLKTRGNVIAGRSAEDDSEPTPLAQPAGADDWQESVLNEGGELLELTAMTGQIQLRTDREPQPESLGGSGNSYFSLGGSGNDSQRRAASAAAIEKTTGTPRPGAMVPIEVSNGGNIDGYTLYLPVSHSEQGGPYPVIVYLQGGYGVGGEITGLSDWGLPRLIRDEQSLDSERNQLLLDTFIVVSIHIQEGNYDDNPDVIAEILDSVQAKYQGDPKRIYVTGLSRGGHGSWGLCNKLPQRFAAAAPIGGLDRSGVDHSVFREIAVWVAHNQGDPTIEFSNALSAVDKVEQAIDVGFKKFTQPVPPADEVMDERYIFVRPNLDRHDAWTETYCSVEFYRWLLKQSR